MYSLYRYTQTYRPLAAINQALGGLPMKTAAAFVRNSQAGLAFTAEPQNSIRTALEQVINTLLALPNLTMLMGMASMIETETGLPTTPAPAARAVGDGVQGGALPVQPGNQIGINDVAGLHLPATNQEGSVDVHAVIRERGGPHGMANRHGDTKPPSTQTEHRSLSGSPSRRARTGGAEAGRSAAIHLPREHASDQVRRPSPDVARSARAKSATHKRHRSRSRSPASQKASLSIPLPGPADVKTAKLIISELDGVPLTLPYKQRLELRQTVLLWDFLDVGGSDIVSVPLNHLFLPAALLQPGQDKAAIIAGGKHPPLSLDAQTARVSLKPRYVDICFQHEYAKAELAALRGNVMRQMSTMSGGFVTLTDFEKMFEPHFQLYKEVRKARSWLYLFLIITHL